MTRIRTAAALTIVAAAAACRKAPPPVVYQAVPVERRDIIVSAQAAGAIQPDTTVEVKSKASGEVLQMLAETGQEVKQGELLVRIDPRIPNNTLAQARADLSVAHATLSNAASQKKRSDELYKSQSITQQEHETSQLAYANASASVIKARVAVENASIQAADANVRSPINGTIIEKSVERGQLIQSATGNVSGGTVLLKMADLNLVQVNALVDETDVGKIRPGMAATVTVDAYPNRPFEGSVLKIEPQATVQQNVTMFPVRVRIQNQGGLLRPGMNTEVQIHIGERDSVLAIPNSALRTTRDVGSAAQVLGLNPEEVQKQLAAAPAAAPAGRPAGDSATRASMGATTAGDSAAKAAGGANTMTLPNGATAALPAGVTAAQVQAIMQKRMSGGQPTQAESAILRKVFQGAGGGRGGAGGGGAGGGGAGGGAGRGNRRNNAADFGGSYVVFVKRSGRIVPVNIRTGLTDLDYSEVTAGLADGDSVLVLPSAGLVQSQQEFKDRFNRMTGGGAVPGMQQ
ncbi:MAG: efflux RND transporter periplasmic adaptor subunit, partial [Gemmatimonadales bacterium]|nr:efflux RND transporter periplasmic adaptor subunit [Gemmatimonadales bacterium]